MEPLKTEIDAAWAVMTTPLESFVSDKERAEKGEDWAERMAQTRMVKQLIKAVDEVRGHRRLYIPTVGIGPGVLHAFGFDPTRASAEKNLTEILGNLGNVVQRAGIISWTGASGWRAMLEKADAPPAERAGFEEARLDAIAFRAGWKGKAADRQKYLDGAA